MKKRFLGLISLIAALALTLTAAGCASDSKPSQETAQTDSPSLGFAFSPKLSKSTGGSVRVMGNYGDFEALEAVFADFNIVYPNVQLSYTNLEDYSKNIIGAVTGESAPDIYFISPWMLGNADYQQLFDAAEDLSAPSLGIDTGIIRDELLYRDSQGHIPALPVFSSSYGMLVNEDIFKLYGLKVPETYTDLLMACATLKQAGYRSPVMGFNDRSGMFVDLVYPYFCGKVKNDSDARAKLNALEPEAGEYMRSSLECIKSISRSGCIDFDYCKSVSDGYDKLIYRFLEGDVPMMLCHGDTPAGTLRRETGSTTFSARPFNYTFCPFPIDDNGAWFVNTLSITFAVNKNSGQLSLANEFMRFVCSKYELNKLSELKRLMPTTKEIDPGNMYAPFAKVDEAHTIYSRQFGLADAPANQLRIAAHAVANGSMSVDDAVAKFGSLK